MLEFLLALLTTATVGVLLVPLLRTRVASTDRLDNDLAVYRDQLAEIAREHAAGTMSEGDAAAARLEIERRILAAAERDGPAATSPAAHRFLPPALCLLLPLFALGVYLAIGQPGMPSAPFAERPRAAPGGPAIDIPGLIASARRRLGEKPDDPGALAALGEALTLEADGTVTAPAADAFRKALASQPGDPRASYYLGLHEAQSGDSKAALERWTALEARSPPDAPWLPMLRGEIERVARAAGLPVPAAPPSAAPPSAAPPSAAPRGPTREQVEQMQNLSPADRQQAIRSMVEGLAAKMRDNPADRDGWLRLANARRVLGDSAEAAEAFQRADALKPIDDAPTLADWAETWVRQVPANGAPSPQAVEVLQRLEKAEPRNALALFYLGVASWAAGDKAEAGRRWKALLALLPPDAPIRELLQQKIKETE